MQILAPVTAAVVVLLVGVAMLTGDKALPVSDQAAVTKRSDDTGDVAVQPPVTIKQSDSNTEHAARRMVGDSRVETLSVRSLQQCVADAQVIVVATAIGPDPVTPIVPRKPPEYRVQFEVHRVLKGELAAKQIVTQMPHVPDEIIGKQWVVMLEPGYLAGQFPYAGLLWSKGEAEVKELIAKEKKSNSP
jgi:hypothetical protein